MGEVQELVPSLAVCNRLLSKVKENSDLITRMRNHYQNLLTGDGRPSRQILRRLQQFGKEGIFLRKALEVAPKDKGLLTSFLFPYLRESKVPPPQQPRFLPFLNCHKIHVSILVTSPFPIISCSHKALLSERLAKGQGHFYKTYREPPWPPFRLLL